MFALPTIRAALAAALLAMVPHAPVVGDRVDMIELNRVYDHEGQPVLTQMIFWDWHMANGRFHVVAWRLWKDENIRPTRDWRRGEWLLLWHDGELLREVRAEIWRESWTQHDPELLDREVFAKARRRGLSLDSPLAGAKPSSLSSPEP